MTIQATTSYSNQTLSFLIHWTSRPKLAWFSWLNSFDSAYSRRSPPLTFLLQDDYAALIKELKEAFEPEGLLLTAAVGPNKDTVDDSYILSEMAKYRLFTGQRLLSEPNLTGEEEEQKVSKFVSKLL